nr:hypothetical protein [Vibrio fortis]
MSIYSNPIFKLSLLSIAVFQSFNAVSSEATDESVEVIGVQYAKPITVSEPGQTTIDWQEVEEQQYSNLRPLSIQYLVPTLTVALVQVVSVSISVVF